MVSKFPFDVIQTINNQCIECTGPTTTKCRNCVAAYCKRCFHKTHNEGKIFKTHTMITISTTEPLNENVCQEHNGLDFIGFCSVCRKKLCSKCEKNHTSSHKIQSILSMVNIFFLV